MNPSSHLWSILLYSSRNIFYSQNEGGKKGNTHQTVCLESTSQEIINELHKKEEAVRLWHGQPKKNENCYEILFKVHCLSYHITPNNSACVFFNMYRWFPKSCTLTRDQRDVVKKVGLLCGSLHGGVANIWKERSKSQSLRREQ